MFLHLVKYQLKTFLKLSDEIFWCILFPYLLATLFSIAFGNIMDSMDSFEPLPAAIVKEASADKYSTQFLDELSKSGDHQMIIPTYCSKEEAASLLEQEKVLGILTVTDHISLTIKENDYKQSILKSLLDQYGSISESIHEIIDEKPEALQDCIASLSSEICANKEITLSKHNNLDMMTSYFYALLAMTCLFNSFLGYKVTISNQANISSLGARPTMAPVSRFTQVISDFTACLIVSVTNMCVFICYLLFCLKVDLSDRLPFVFLTVFVGCVLGISFGIFVTSIGKGGKDLKISLLISIQMIFCFLGGLMFSNMKDIVEQHCPILNRINPAALIADAIYSLSIYDSYDRFFMNLSILSGMAIVFVLLSIFMTRRERYAAL